MATATARTNAARKAKANKAAAAKNGSKSKPAAAAEVGARELGRQRDLELAPKIKEARDNGVSWADIKEKFGVDQPKGQVLVKLAGVRPKDRIKLTGVAKEDAALVKAARDNDELSWADISVRAGITMGKVKALYGGGGRLPSKAKAAKPAAKKPAAKKASTKGRTATVAKGRGRGKVAVDPSTRS